MEQDGDHTFIRGEPFAADFLPSHLSGDPGVVSDDAWLTEKSVRSEVVSSALDLPASPLPCPCCGSANLYASATSAMSHGVICRDCGLTMSREYPARWPRLPARLTADERMQEVKRRTLALAVAAWNRRPDHTLRRRHTGEGK